jgi:Holliday junction resolvase RusA-like endonuclease
MDLDPENPPQFGNLEFELAVAPVSQQAASAEKKKLVEQIRARTRPLKYIVDSEVQIDIEWLIHEKLRWETDASPDVDNIIKPFLDGLCGCDGVLLDDCQVQSIQCSWISWNRFDQKVTVRVRFDPDRYLQKAGLSFVRLKGALCFPIPEEIRTKGALQLWLDALERSLVTREEIRKLTNDYYPARYALPGGFIHRSRIRGFPVHDLADLRMSPS